MGYPTDDELEAMAVDIVFFHPGETSELAAAMLRACKGRGWQPMENAPIFGKVLRYDPRRREGEQVFECPADGGFWRHEKMPGMWMHMPEPPGSAALDPAPDQGEWDAALESAKYVARHVKEYCEAPMTRTRGEAFVAACGEIERRIDDLKKGTP